MILKQCRCDLSLPLHFLFSLSLSSGLFPVLWKSSFVQPIFKNEDRPNSINYRPVYLMPTITKLFESILLLKFNFSFSNYIIPTNFNFISYYDYLTVAVEKETQVDAIIQISGKRLAQSTMQFWSVSWSWWVFGVTLKGVLVHINLLGLKKSDYTIVFQEIYLSPLIYLKLVIFLHYYSFCTCKF